jgi:cytoskeletal protein CcmA (bactofilin family)
MMEERRVGAWIGTSIIIKGELTSSEDLSIAGQVEGNVTVREHALVIASGGTIRGDIVAGAVVVHGKVIGNITSPGRVEVGETGTVEGEISAPALAVTEGAALRGRLQISKAVR